MMDEYSIRNRKWMSVLHNAQARFLIQKKMKHVTRQWVNDKFGRDGVYNNGSRNWAWSLDRDLCLLLEIPADRNPAVFYSTAGYTIGARNWTDLEIFGAVNEFIIRELMENTIDVMRRSIDT